MLPEADEARNSLAQWRRGDDLDELPGVRSNPNTLFVYIKMDRSADR